MRLMITALLASSVACASSSALELTQTPTRPLVASMQPVSPGPQPAAADPHFDDTASGFLERAFHHFRRDEYVASSTAFSSAIRTNNLNDAGRALAYWHVHLCQYELGKIDASAEALMSFSTVAEQMVQERTVNPFSYGANRDFMARFNIEGRLARARALLSATWVARSGDYGRSSDIPVRVESSEELEAFLELAPPCNNADERQIDRRVLDSRDARSLEEVVLYCDNQREGQRFVIEFFGSR